MALKLDRLPDREAVKITFIADAELKAALNDYAEIYRRTYGQKETVSELIPFMLTAFMVADPGFRRARKQLAETRSQSPSPQTRVT
ncbi:DUF2274 domain-containing protein [Chelativorans sp. M5D2P16]|uniref:DUF2274 domain-containing protein n=1 Tax=Chelativorans sp. M5D2P16 TaxID=3095678 RepID=UPI002ACABFEC|nr:DUF2274 domain-containing protein [Chelativorans sp. M5D2P16]MDZ5696716.1 DUF2274 domain-containing protein [Chelativorans sp. M5D2P16]